ncbi:hypothetical protein Trydic_g23470 [Trypoxylus dichotomus]
MYGVRGAAGFCTGPCTIYDVHQRHSKAPGSPSVQRNLRGRPGHSKIAVGLKQGTSGQNRGVLLHLGPQEQSKEKASDCVQSHTPKAATKDHRARTEIEWHGKIDYLGMIFDNRLTFSEHSNGARARKFLDKLNRDFFKKILTSKNPALKTAVKQKIWEAPKHRKSTEEEARKSRTKTSSTQEGIKKLPASSK